MPTILGRPYALKTDLWPPHMSPEDYAIFRRWASSAFQRALKVFYDVGLGAGADYPKDTNVEMVRMWTKVTQKRADMVIEYEDKVALVELRDGATANAVGRLLVYKMLWYEDPVITKPLTLYLVTNRYDKEIERLCKSVDITYFVV